MKKSVCYLKGGHLLAALVNPLAVHRSVDADCLVLGPAGLEYYTVSGNRAFVATVGVKPGCTPNVAIQIVAGQVVCTGSERAHD